MNASMNNGSETEFDYLSEFKHADTNDRPAQKSRLTYGRQRGKQPRSYNGIHRRRQRRIKW